MHPISVLTLIRKENIEIKEKNLTEKEILLIDPISNNVSKIITTNVITYNTGEDPGVSRITVQDLPFILELQVCKRISKDEKSINCEYTNIYSQNKWIEEKLNQIKLGKRLISPVDDLTWNPSFDDIIQRIIKKDLAKECLLSDDIAEINEILFALNDYILF